MSDERIAKITAWLAENAASEFGPSGFFDYCEAAIQDETDLGVRYLMAERLDALKDALLGATP